MRAREFTEGLVDKGMAALAKKISPQQLELPFAAAPKAAVTPRQIEYWGYLPGETPQSRQMWTKRFNNEQEAQAWINQRNATPLGSKEIQEGLLGTIGNIAKKIGLGAEKELPRIDPVMGKPTGATPTPTRPDLGQTPKPTGATPTPVRPDFDKTPRPTPIYTTPKPTAGLDTFPALAAKTARAERVGLQLHSLPGTQDKIVQIGTRPIVVVDIDGFAVPFYVSTGSGGKAGVPVGKWYPFFGIGQKGWFNKGWTEEMIINYYGNAKLARVARVLDSSIGDVRNLAGEMMSGQPALGIINAGKRPFPSHIMTPDEQRAYERYIMALVDSI